MKKIHGLGIAAIIAIMAVTSAGIAGAQSFGNPDIVQKLAERFGLNVEEVQRVFDQQRDERMQQAQEKMNDRLEEFEQEGRITEDQKNQILAKQEEVQSQILDLGDLSPEERKEKMSQIKTDLRDWAEENGIDIPLGLGIMGPMGRGFRMGGFGRFMGGPCPHASANTNNI